MKYISTLFLTIVLMLSSATYAQSKVAHIDFQKLISEMPSVLAAQEEVQRVPLRRSRHYRVWHPAARPLRRRRQCRQELSRDSWDHAQSGRRSRKMVEQLAIPVGHAVNPDH